MRIAIIKLGAMGDVLRTTVLLRPFHRKYPGCEIWWFTQASARPLLERNPWITKIIDVKSFSASQLESVSFDLVLGLDDEEIACALSSSLPTAKRFGAYLKNGVPRYTESSKAWFDMGLLNRDPDGSLTTANYLKALNTKTYPSLLFEMLDLLPIHAQESEPFLIPDPVEERWAQDFAAQYHLRQDDEQLIGFNTGAGSRWINKQLSIPTTLSLINALGRMPNQQLLLLGGPDEHQRNQSILAQAPESLVDTGTRNTVARFISIVNLCDVLVTGDTLALHIATALGKKVIAFFGPTSAPEIEFYGRGIALTPEPKCECFYRPRCEQNSFCLDRLDLTVIEKKIFQWRSERESSCRTQ